MVELEITLTITNSGEWAVKVSKEGEITLRNLDEASISAALFIDNLKEWVDTQLLGE